MSRRDFATALRDAARTLTQDGMPAAVDRRVRERIARATSVTARRMRWWRAGGIAVAAAVAATVLVLVVRDPRPDPRLAGFDVVEASGDLRARPEPDGVLVVVAGSATVRSDESQMTITTRTPARIRKQRAGIRVIAGVVDVSVARRRSGAPPARVEVSHGSIEVRGTRFRIEQRADGGQVRLDEGVIVFIADDGRRRDLRAGDALRWPLPPEPPPHEVPPPEPALHEVSPPEPPPREPAPREHVPPPRAPSQRRLTQEAPPAPAPSREPTVVPPASATVDAARLFREIAELRARGQYREAAEAIERQLDTPGLRDETRELMSFELASIRTYQLADKARACAALARHARQYPGSAHAAAVARARTDLGCPDDPGATLPPHGR